jgi:hypothetical protein
MDKAFVVDRKGNTYGTILTDINFTFFGFTTFKNSAENAVRNASSFGSQTIIKAQQMIKQEKTARELAQQNLTKALVESSGLYFTKVKQKDGSEIRYGHNKPTLEESDTVWKFTAGAIGVSTDGGKTYAYGFTVIGELLANVLTVYGVNADWINAGTIKGVTIISDNPDTPYSTQIKDGSISIYGSKSGVPLRAGRIGSFKKTSETDNDGFCFILEKEADAMAFGIRTEGTSFNTAYYVNNGYNPNGYTERHVFFGDERHDGDMKCWTINCDTDVNCVIMNATRGQLGSLYVSGTKSRIAKTKSYNERLLYCYEMPSPIFGDVGHGVIGEDGLCYIDIDQVFFETIDTKQSYHVFLQSYSEKNVFVTQKEQGHFVVRGEPNTEFDWEIKAKQFDFPLERLEEQLPKDDYSETDYVTLANEYLKKQEKELLKYE